MEKINFINDTTPALNATNLNKLQQNVEDVTGDLTDLETSAKNNLVEAINEAASTGGNINVYNEYTTSETDTYSCNYVNGLETYSTTETRIGTWIDNKPIYRKVFNFTTDSSDKTMWTNLFQISDMDIAINIYGVIPNFGGNKTNIPRYESTSYYLIFNTTGTQVKYRCVGFTSASGKLVVEYTKTTD